MDSLRSREHRLFPGLFPALAVLAGLFGFARGSPPGADPARITRAWLARSAAAGAVLLVALTLRLDGRCHSAYWILCECPGAGAVRAVGRVALVLTFPAALALALTAQAVFARLSHGGWVGVGVAGTALLGAVIADQTVRSEGLVRFSKRDVQQMARCLADAVRRADPPPPAFVLCSRENGDGLAHPVGGQVEAMMAAQELGIPTLNGYTGHPPRGWWFFFKPADVDRWAAGRLSPDERARVAIIDPATLRR